MTPLELTTNAVRILDKKKAAKLNVIGIKDISALADYFVLATGTSTTHVKSLTDELEFQLKELGVEPRHVEGYSSNSWDLIDYGSVIVHIFTPDARGFYDLDRLWQDGEEVPLEQLLPVEEEA